MSGSSVELAHEQIAPLETNGEDQILLLPEEFIFGDSQVVVWCDAAKEALIFCSGSRYRLLMLERAIDAARADLTAEQWIEEGEAFTAELLEIRREANESWRVTS